MKSKFVLFCLALVYNITLFAQTLIPVTGVSLNKTELVIYTTDSIQLIAIVEPEDATNKNVVWSSSNESIATVDSDGWLRPKAKGNVEITTKTEDGEKTAVCAVQVKMGFESAAIVATQGDKVEVGRNISFNSQVTPDEADKDELVWWSEDETIATINSQGTVTGLKLGKVFIHLGYINLEGDKISLDSREIEVVETQTNVISITLEGDSVVMHPGETRTIPYKFNPENPTNKGLMWMSTTGNKVIEVDAMTGEITAKTVGNATVRVVTADGGKMDEILIKVMIPVDWVIIEPTELTLGKKDSTVLKATVLPFEAQQDVTWESSDTTIVTVDSIGQIKALKGGHAQIVVTTVDMGKKDTCDVTVHVAVDSVELVDDTINMELGADTLIIVKFFPDDATNKNMTWKSSNPMIATINEKGEQGKVLAHSVGTTIIKATTEEGGYELECVVNVTVALQKIVLPDTAEVYIKDTLALNPVFLPDNATNKDIIWQMIPDTLAQIDTLGNVIGLKGGQTMIIATAKEDSTIIDTCLLTVKTRFVDSIRIEPAPVLLVKGETKQMEAVVKPINATKQEVTWEIADTTIATVDALGNVKAVAGGKTILKAIATDGSKVYDTCQVVVSVSLTKLELDTNLVVLKKEEMNTLHAIITPLDATDTIVWTSSDSTIVTLQDSIITAVNHGVAYVKVATKDGKFEAICKVVVTPEFEELKLEQHYINLQPKKSHFLNVMVKPEDANIDVLFWMVKDSTIAVVNQGIVTAKKIGKTLVYVSTPLGNLIDSCIVSVTEKPEIPVVSITLSKTTVEMYVDDKVMIDANIFPVNAFDKTLIWTSKADSIASVSATGTITAKSIGTTTITAKSRMDTTIVAHCEVVVKKRLIESIVVEPSPLKMDRGETLLVTALIAPINATEKNLIWTIEDPQVAQVDTLGNVKAIAGGITILKATAKDGSGVYDTCQVIVMVPIEKIELDTNQIILKTNDTYELSATITPKDATNKTLVWISSDTTIVTVKDGNVKAVADGIATITVTTEDGALEATCKVIVSPIFNKLELEDSYINLQLEKSKFLNVIVEPVGANIEVLTWSTADATTAVVEKGIVTAKKLGKTLIYVATPDGTLKDSCVVSITKEPEVPLVGVKLDKEKVDMRVGDKVTINTTFYPANASNKKLIWKSSNDIVASVDSTGTITAKFIGKTTITVITEDGNYSASVVVNVDAAFVPVDSIILSADSVELEVGGSAMLVAIVQPLNATNQEIQWKSSNMAIVVVKDGLLVGVSEGQAKVTVTSVEGQASAECVVTVKKAKQDVTGVVLNVNEITITPAKDEQLYATVLPTSAVNKKVHWESKNEKVVTVKDGLLHAVNAGTTIVTVTTEVGNYSASCMVTVQIDATKLTIDKAQCTLLVGQTLKLNATVEPTNAAGMLSWESNNDKVASVKDGLITANSGGQAIITAKTPSGLTATCQVEVIVPVTGLTLDAQHLTVYNGDMHKLVPTITPFDATNQKVVWTSTNENIIKVEDGVITAVAEGDADVIAHVDDGDYGTYADTCHVTSLHKVIAVEAIILSDYELELFVTDTTTITATVLPENADNKNFYWITSNSAIVSVQNGKLTAINEGEAIITAVTEDGLHTASCVVNVIKLIDILEDVTINNNKVRKVYYKGVMYIIKNGGIYTIDGRLVRK